MAALLNREWQHVVHRSICTRGRKATLASPRLSSVRTPGHEPRKRLHATSDL